MRTIAWVLVLMAVFPPLASAVPKPESVAVLYNTADPESLKLAEQYRDARDIPPENLIGLKMPVAQDISREEFENQIRKPLLREFDRKRWWKRGRDSAGVTLPVANRIRVLVTMRGVPLRIKTTPKPDGKAPAAPNAPNPFAGHDEASVDSELSMFGVEGLPADGGLQNKFYKSEKSITDSQFPFLILTARIDAPTFATCQRMIRDAVETEKGGLWGMAYVDVANKFPQGDQWLESVIQSNARAGVPTVIDRFNETLPKNYPMTQAALYYGWYDWNVSGPFLNPRFKFRKGAVAVHLHSFSAEQLRNRSKNWSGPLLERGAAVTIGNVFEPFLHMTHDLGILHRQLLAGDSWVEAAWKAMPVTSWQGVVLGDPLYQPFKHLDGSGEVRAEDIDFRALRAAQLKWPSDVIERRNQLDKAAERMKSGIISEAVGLDLAARGLSAEAMFRFRQAKGFYTATEDKLRLDFHQIAMDRNANRKDLAIRGLHDAQILYRAMPEAEALKAWLDILDPPPAPPTAPGKSPAVRKTAVGAKAGES